MSELKLSKIVRGLLRKRCFFSLVLSFGEVRSQHKEENFVLAKSGFVFRNEILKITKKASQRHK